MWDPTFDAIDKGAKCMDITEFTRFCSDYGFIPRMFRVNQAKDIFYSANIGEARDERRGSLSCGEFEYAVKRCIAEAFAVNVSGEVLPEGVEALWELIHGKNEGLKEGKKSQGGMEESIIFRPFQFSGADSAPGATGATALIAVEEDARQALVTHGAGAIEAKMIRLRREIHERFEMLSLLADAKTGDTDSKRSYAKAQGSTLHDEIHTRVQRMSVLGAPASELTRLEGQAKEHMSRLLGESVPLTATLAQTKKNSAIKVQSAIRAFNAARLGEQRLQAQKEMNANNMNGADLHEYLKDNNAWAQAH